MKRIIQFVLKITCCICIQRYTFAWFSQSNPRSELDPVSPFQCVANLRSPRTSCTGTDERPICSCRLLPSDPQHSPLCSPLSCVGHSTHNKKRAGNGPPLIVQSILVTPRGPAKGRAQRRTQSSHLVAAEVFVVQAFEPLLQLFVGDFLGGGVDDLGSFQNRFFDVDRAVEAQG